MLNVAEKLKNYSEKEKPDKEFTEGVSNHIQFINNNINAIGLSQEGSKDIIHTLKDTMDKVDISYIENWIINIGLFFLYLPII